MIVVTGGAGFIGSALIWELNRRGITDILVVDTFRYSPEKWKNLRGLRFLDVVSPEELEKTIEASQLSAEKMFNLGACTDTTERDVEYLLEVNYRWAKRLCLYCLSKGIRFIHASSAATYGLGEKGFSDEERLLPYLRPLNPYGFSKHLFDLWAYRKGILKEIVVLKYFNVYGPNEYHKGNMRSMVVKAYEQIQREGKVRLFKSTDSRFPDGGQRRDFVYVKDAVKVTLFLSDCPDAGGVYNVGTGRSHTWLDLVEAIFESLGKSPVVEFVDMPEDLVPQYQNFTEANVSKLYELGFKDRFFSLKDAVREYVQNYLLPGRFLGDDLLDAGAEV